MCPYKSMRAAVLLTAALCAIISSSAIRGAAADLADPVLAPPGGVFVDPRDLKDYLAKLNNYYQLLGRPRFGKRDGGASVDMSLIERRQRGGEDNNGEELLQLLRHILYFTNKG